MIQTSFHLLIGIIQIGKSLMVDPSPPDSGRTPSDLCWHWLMPDVNWSKYTTLMRNSELFYDNSSPNNKSKMFFSLLTIFLVPPCWGHPQLQDELIFIQINQNLFLKLSSEISEICCWACFRFNLQINILCSGQGWYAEFLFQIDLDF